MGFFMEAGYCVRGRKYLGLPNKQTLYIYLDKVGFSGDLILGASENKERICS